jgi:hypothetical protein
MKFQIPSTNNQIMTKIPIIKISKCSESFDVWNLVIGYYLEFGLPARSRFGEGRDLVIGI